MRLTRAQAEAIVQAHRAGVSVSWETTGWKWILSPETDGTGDLRVVEDSGRTLVFEVGAVRLTGDFFFIGVVPDEMSLTFPLEAGE